MVKKLIMVCLIVLLFLIMPGYHQVSQLISKQINKPMTLVIDPGHGGLDSGAVGDDNTLEKDVNLEISKKLRDEALRYGVNVILTREEDRGLFQEEEKIGPWSKIGDIKERERIIEEAKADLVISIHLNSFKQDNSVRGAQVFYPKKGDEQLCEEDKSIAEAVQESLVKGIADGSDRVTLPKSDMHLLNNVNTNIILIECGFLSNNEDLKMLKSAKFQHKICVYIMKGLVKKYSLSLKKEQLKTTS